MVARCADKILVLDQGEAAAIDEPKKIFGNPEIVEKGGSGVPDYVKLSQALKEQYYTEREIEITEGPRAGVEMVKEVLKI